MRCLGLDIGSSSIKGAVLDLETRSIGATISRPFPAPIAGLPAGWFEVDPQEVERAVVEVIEGLLELAPEATALFASGQMGGVILVDQTGAALTNYLSWRDQRTTLLAKSGRPYLQAARETLPAELLSALGNEMQAGSATTLLYWLTENGSLPKERSIIATLGDYVLGKLCGARPRMHATQAIGLLDLSGNRRGNDFLSWLGLTNLHLLESPVLGIEPTGDMQIRGKPIRVYGVYGDQQCALRGAGLARGELSINISTGSQVSRRTEKFQPGNYQTRPYFDGDYLDTITHLPAGRSLNVLVGLLSELAAAEGITLQKPWENLVRLASEVESSALEVNLAFFTGPLGSSGKIEGITTENLHAGQLFHAAFRAMADNYARCAEWLDPQKSWRSVVLSGGMTKGAPLLRRMIEQRFDAPIRESAGEETLLGLLDIALVTETQRP